MTLRVLISFALWGRVLASQCPSGNCDDDNVLMQMDKFHKGMTSTQHKLISDKSLDCGPMWTVLHAQGLGGYNPHDVKADATWQKCTAINWTKVAGEPTMEGKLNLPSIQMTVWMLEELELSDHCACPGPWCNDDTCKAVFAAIEVFTELCASEFDPVFANYSVTSWGYYPSWVVGTVTGLNYADEMPVKVTLKHPKGVCGYAVCDLLRTILTQSANQMSTGTCSYVASLAALSKKAPARAIKVAVRLFWLGEITPGLSPLNSESSEDGRLAAILLLRMAENWGYCSNDTVRAGVTYPGQSQADAALATKNQGGWYNSMVWECKSLFDIDGDSTCRLVINPLTCALGVHMAPLCKEKWSKELAFPVMNEVFQWDIMEIRSEAYEKGIVTEEGQEAYVLPALKAKYSGAQYTKVAFSNPEIIYQLKLQKLPAFGNYGLPDKSYGCNHAVFLSECDHEANEYTIWTWGSLAKLSADIGTSVKLTREILLGYPTTQRGYHTAPDSYVPAWNTGALCAAVIADKIWIRRFEYHAIKKVQLELLGNATLAENEEDAEQGIKQPNRSPVEKISDLSEPLTGRGPRSSRTLSMTQGAAGYMELPALDPQELAADVAKESSRRQWMEPLTYTEKVKVSLARALIMNPDLLVLHRPFHHFDLGTADSILNVIKIHHENRGACLPAADLTSRRPRCVVFSPETVEQAQQAHILWQIDHLEKTVREVGRNDLNHRFEPMRPAQAG
eukprot:s638_g7.t1